MIKWLLSWFRRKPPVLKMDYELYLFTYADNFRPLIDTLHGAGLPFVFVERAGLCACEGMAPRRARNVCSVSTRFAREALHEAMRRVGGSDLLISKPVPAWFFPVGFDEAELAGCLE
jgi:hypothetical protein